MKTITGLFCIFCCACVSNAQELILKRGVEQFSFAQKDQNIWVTRMDAKEYYLIPKGDVDKMLQIIDKNDALIHRHETVLASQDSLINDYEKYRQTADAHIEKQKEMLVVADSLQQGYKSIYHDLKQLIGLPKMYFDTGLGFLHGPQDVNRLMGSLGVGYGSVHANALVGKNVWGATIGIRWPINF